MQNKDEAQIERDDKALVERLSERITQAGIFRQAIMLTNGEARELRDRIEAQAAEIERLWDSLMKASREIQGYKDALAQVWTDTNDDDEIKF